MSGSPPRLTGPDGRVLALGRQLGRGGEGLVYTIDGDDSRVVKVYHRPPAPETAQKLAAMVRLAGPDLLAVAAWPLGLARDARSDAVAGFVMPRAAGTMVQQLYAESERLRAFPRAGWAFQARAARNLAAAFEEVHSAGHLVADINQSNAFVTPQATVRLIDCDSFQIRAGGKDYLCEVGVPHYTPPELQGKPLRGVVRTPNHDRFGLAVLVYQLLFVGRHPYSGLYSGPGDPSFEQLIAECRFAQGPRAKSWGMAPPPHAPTFLDIPPGLGGLFRRAFEPAGKTAERPRPAEWVAALDQLKTETAVCAADDGHQSWKDAPGGCVWCRLARNNGPEYYYGASTSAGSFAVDEAKLAEVLRRLEAVSATEFGYDRSKFRASAPAPRPLPAEFDRLTREVTLRRQQLDQARRAEGVHNLLDEQRHASHLLAIQLTATEGEARQRRTDEAAVQKRETRLELELRELAASEQAAMQTLEGVERTLNERQRKIHARAARLSRALRELQTSEADEARLRADELAARVGRIQAELRRRGEEIDGERSRADSAAWTAFGRLRNWLAARHRGRQTRLRAKSIIREAERIVREVAQASARTWAEKRRELDPEAQWVQKARNALAARREYWRRQRGRAAAEAMAGAGRARVRCAADVDGIRRDGQSALKPLRESWRRSLDEAERAAGAAHEARRVAIAHAQLQVDQAAQALQSAHAAELSARRETFRTTAYDLASLEKSWIEWAGWYRNRVRDCEAAVRGSVTQCRGLGPEYGRKLAALTGAAEWAARDRHLKSCMIGDPGERIPGVGAARIHALESRGVRTAYDVTEEAVAGVKGFGPALTNNLLDWRQSKLAAYRFDPKGVAPSPECRALVGSYRELQRGIFAGIDAHFARLRAASAECASAIRQLAPRVQSAVAALAQAEADARALESAG